MIGRILSCIAGTYSVAIDEQIVEVKARGNFKYKKEQIFVGDYVELSNNNDYIISLKPRYSLLNRPRIANIDHILIVMSLCEPTFSYSLIFRYLTYTNINNISASLVVSKIAKNNDEKKIDEIKNVFSTLGINVYFVDSKLGYGINELKSFLNNKTFALVGTSAVGKSTLINALDPSLKRQEGEYSYALQGGKHQTKETILLPFNSGYIADTPGFYNLDLKIDKSELANYYPGIKQYYTKCYYSNCLHLKEKDCAIKRALNDAKLPQIVYDCYVQELNNINNRERN